ncbi:MAG: putative bifunctional diguanylate cyclase/phosphodiesterase [Saccharofermentanales bacterium]|nr:EAL domain-containing protein [Clostridiaceae bacterium]
MLVTEYYDRIAASDKENLLYFLKFIANILGDTKKKVAYEEKLYDFAYFDETTKLANRNMLKNDLEQILYNRKESEKIAVFDIELDNLMMINDTFGHGIGEQIVIKSAAILENLVKNHCIIARAAEGKFIVVLPAVENTEQIEECAKSIRESFLYPLSPEEGIEALFVLISIGISVYPDDGRDAETLLKNADLAGNEAKTADNKIVFFSEQLISRIAENTLLTNKLFRSLQNDEYSLVFQPQISCQTGKTAGVEALLRWTTADNQRISPDIFIPILEQTGLIHDVGHWVLEQTLQVHNRLVKKGFPPLRFSVNLSVVQFRKKDFVLDVSKLIEECQVDPKYIELEITESMLSENFPDTIEKLVKLKELGINIVIDDFGRGYSSLHRLESIPFNRIKIDKSITDGITLKRKKAVIAEAIVSLAKTLMVDITVEGVETKEQVDFLKGIACDEIQGYYFSKPLSEEALAEFLKKEMLQAP